MSELQNRTPEQEGVAGGGMYNVDAIRQSILEGKDYPGAREAVNALPENQMGPVEKATDQQLLAIRQRNASPEGTYNHPDVLSATEATQYLREDIGRQGIEMGTKHDERMIMNAEAEEIARQQRENLIQLKKEVEEALHLVGKSRSMKIIGSLCPVVGRIWGPKRDERLKAKLEQLNMAGSEGIMDKSGYKNAFRGEVLTATSLVFPPAFIAAVAFGAVGVVDNLRKFGELKGTRENLQTFLNQLNSGIDSITHTLNENEIRKVQYGEAFTNGLEGYSGINLN